MSTCLHTVHLDDDNLYLRCLDVGEIRIRKITNPGQVVGTVELYKIVNTMNDGLKVFDEIISGPRLRELEAELKKCKIYVNRQGYCYIVVDYVGGEPKPHRLNDFFNWSKYGVVPKITTIWNRCEMNTNAVVIDYEKMEKEFADMKLQLQEKDKIIHHLNDTLELKARDVMEKNKCIAKKEEELREMAESVERSENEKETHITLKNQELKDCKLQLEKREKELSILISLCERRLGVFGSSSNSYNEGFIDKDKELRLYKACLEENECELRKISSQLSAEQKRVDDLKFAMNSVASYVNHMVNASIDKEANYNFPAPATRGGRERVSLWRDLEDGSTGATVDT